MYRTLLKKGSWFFAFNSILFLIVSFQYFQFFTEVKSGVTIFYLVILSLSHFMAFSYLVFLFLYLPMVFIVRKEGFAWRWAAISASLVALVLLIDAFVFKLYRFHINSYIIDLVFGGAASQIFVFHYKQYILAGTVLFVFVGGMLLLSKFIFKVQNRIVLRKGWVIPVLGAVMMITSHMMHAWANASNFREITKVSRYYPLYFPTTDDNLMLKLGLVDSIAGNNYKYVEGENEGLNYPKNKISWSDTVNKPNIMVVLLDSWYYKAFGSIITPRLYEFSKKCEVYNHHYSGSNGTRTGVFSLFYSIPGTYWYDVKSSQIGSVLVDELLKKGYDVNALASASLASPPFNKTVFSKVEDLQLHTQGDAAHERDEQINKSFFKYIDNKFEAKDSTPFFSFLFYDALHAFSYPESFKGPFQPEWEYPKYEQLSNDTDVTSFLNLYKNTAFYLDSLMGDLFQYLEAKSLLEDTWIVVTGDHGQEFNDNGKNYWGHNGNYSAAQMQVPLMVYRPDGKHKSYDHWTNHYDIVPSLFNEALGCENEISDYSVGKMLNDTTERNSMIVGSKDNFAILLNNQIISFNFTGSLDVTDFQLNEMDVNTLDFAEVNKIILESKSFYQQN